MSSLEIEVEFPEIYDPLDEPYRYKVLYGGRAAARSWTIARKLLLRGSQEPLRILCTRELQKSIQQSVHKLLLIQIKKLGLEYFYNTNKSAIEGLNGTEFIFFGTRHNPDEIKSTEGINIAWIEEGHSLTEESWDIIDPTIREEGSEVWISYNTRFKFDYIHKLFVIDKPPPETLVIKGSYKDNPFFPEVLRKQMETMKEKDYEKYLNIWEGELKTLAEGAIFGKQITALKKNNRRIYIPIQSNCEVCTFSDVGKNDPSAYWFMQQVGKEYRFIDYFEGRLEEIEYYTRALKGLGYNYGHHYFPHDADHDRLGMKRNIKEQFEDGGIKPITIVQRVSDKTVGIELARDIFSQCWFHIGNDDGLEVEDCDGYLNVPGIPDDMRTRAQRMDKGMDALSNYRYKYRELENVYAQTPHHDWASNGADAFMQFAQGYPETVESRDYRGESKSGDFRRAGRR